MDDFRQNAPHTQEEIPPPAHRRVPAWPFVVAGIMLLLGSFIFAAVAIPISMPYYALAPGPVSDVSDYVQVDHPSTTTKGEFFFLTVSLQEVNVLEWVAAKLDGRVDLAPRENIRPAGVSQDTLRRQNIDLMERSKENAKYVALTYLGYDVTYRGSGALINGIIDNSAAQGVLQEGDIIVAVDGEPIEFMTEAVDAIGGRAPGDQVTLTIQRPNPDNPDEVDTRDVTLTLGPYRYTDENGETIEDSERGMVGVTLTDANVEVVFPVNVKIDSQNIGGPSAGMMFTLEIIDELTQEDLTHGRRIAGTGTIDIDGNVGPIGGIRQKVFGAIDAGAEIILVPADNYDEAVAAAGDKITVVKVATIQDAITYLDSLGTT